MKTENILSRVRSGRIRQLAISGVSVFAAALCVIFFSPAEFSAFGYYSIVALLVVNAVLALFQYQQVIRPVESMLVHLADISVRLGAEDQRPFERLPSAKNPAFDCLASGVDGLVESLLERIEELRKVASGHEAMLMSVPIAILVVTREGTVAKILNANGLDKALDGLRLGEKPRPEFWGEANATTLMGNLRKAFANNDAVAFDLAVESAGGRERETYQVTFRRLNDMSAMMTVLRAAVLSSAPERKAESAPATATQKRAALRRMAASIAHDGKNVFAALSNLVSINRESTDPGVRNQIPIAEDAIRRGTVLMTELTTLAGEMHFDLKCRPAADFSTLILETPALKALLPRNVEFLTSVSTKPMPEIDLDADQMWKVASNLVKNAVEAMGGNNGRIWVKVEPCTLTEETARSFRHTGVLRKGAGILVTFTDDGPGIAEDMLDRIFDPYVSIKGNGRGIGLATVMTIVDAHGGGLGVKSSPGYGTTFYLYLPASRNTAEELKLIHEIAPNGEILLIDDDPTILHTTSLVLRSLKIAAHPASNEEDAIAKLRSLRGRTKAVLVDGNIGCVSSAGLVQRIHGEFPGLPVIIVSGSPKETIDDRFAGVPYDRFLSKPYSVAELSAALNDVTPQA